MPTFPKPPNVPNVSQLLRRAGATAVNAADVVRYGGFETDDGGNARVMVDLDGPLKECRRIYVRGETTAADGSALELDILSTSISPEGPAAGGEGTEGGQSIGSVQYDTVPIAKK